MAAVQGARGRAIPQEARVYLGQRIAALRSARGWSRGQLANKAGISWHYLEDLEQGEGRFGPGLSILIDLTNALDLLSIDELVGGLTTLTLLTRTKDSSSSVVK